MMQFSMAPARVLDADHLHAVQAAVRLRQQFGHRDSRSRSRSGREREPILRPLAYHFSGYEHVHDQFLLGERSSSPRCCQSGVASTQVGRTPTWKLDRRGRPLTDRTRHRSSCRSDLESIPWFRRDEQWISTRLASLRPRPRWPEISCSRGYRRCAPVLAVAVNPTGAEYPAARIRGLNCMEHAGGLIGVNHCHDAAAKAASRHAGSKRARIERRDNSEVDSWHCDVEVRRASRCAKRSGLVRSAAGRSWFRAWRRCPTRVDLQSRHDGPPPHQFVAQSSQRVVQILEGNVSECRHAELFRRQRAGFPPLRVLAVDQARAACRLSMTSSARPAVRQIERHVADCHGPCVQEHQPVGLPVERCDLVHDAGRSAPTTSFSERRAVSRQLGPRTSRAGWRSFQAARHGALERRRG